MHLAATRILGLQPDALGRLPSGELLTLSSKPLEAVVLDGHGPGLESRWSTPVRRDALGLRITLERSRGPALGGHYA